MATKYADRVFLSVNGAKMADIQSGSLKQNKNAKAVPSMTDDGFNRGFVQGNTDIDINFVMAIPNQVSRPKVEAIDFENNDVSIVWICGAEQFIATGVFNKDAEDSAGGVGDEAKASFNFGALKLTDAVGNPANFNISF
jgi:hypothetical protein